MEKKIFICFLFAALLITAGCRKDDAPAEVKTPVGFRAMSQVVVSKDSDGTSNKLPDTVEKFGVWGVAGNDLNIQYLWNSSTLTDVNRQSDGTTYVPSSDGYWFSNSTHDFLALASDPSTVALPSVSISHTANSNQLNPSMTFTYDLSARYTAKDYDFDFLGAAARNVVERSIPASQDLIFWHLFSQINISVKFVDANGNDITGNGSTLDKVRLTGVNTRGNYTISYGGTDANPHALNCSVTNHSKSTEFTFTSAPTLNILPQDISNFRLFLDFTLKVDGKDMNVQDFEIDLAPAKKEVEVVLESGAKISPYIFNNQYNWIVKISPKLGISFKIEVAPWTSTPIKDSNNNDEFEII